MKKLKLVGILAAVVLIGSVISIPLINNHTAYKVEKALCEIPLPEETELIESLSQAGKLTGNGNGMQYFGAILIRSDLSLEELDAYYSGKGQILRSTPNTAPLICGAYNTQPEGLSTMA